MEMNDEVINIIKFALNEDIGSGDVTTNSIVPENKSGSARINSKSEGILAGIEIAKKVFYLLDDEIKIEQLHKDGDHIKKGDVLLILHGKLRTILTGERVSLNFLQRMSGIATLTNKFVEKSNCDVYDTRKTTPGLRVLEKYSVIVGGGKNHRMGLYDMALIKDNHIACAGSIKQAIDLCKKNSNSDIKVEIEVTNINEVKEALESKADVIMLDNMSLEQMQKAIEIIDDKAQIEISGGITINTIEEITKIANKNTFVSVGALTHSAKALDIHLMVDYSN